MIKSVLFRKIVSDARYSVGALFRRDHEVNGKVEFFRGCPESWREVSFENIALSDGSRVNGRRIYGTILVEPDWNAMKVF